MRQRRYAVATVMLVAITAGACGTVGRGQFAATEPAAAASRSGEVAWSRLPEAPLHSRHGAHGLWVDDRFLVMGGRDTPALSGASGGNRRRPALRNGASYAPASRRWTRLAEAPAPLGEASTAVVDGVVYWWMPFGDDGLGWPTFLAYDVAADRWQQLPTPSEAGVRWLQLVAAGDLVVAYRAAHEGRETRPDLVYDPEVRTWRDLPLDPLAPSFNRSMVWTDQELVLLALDLRQPGAKGPSLFRAATFDFASESWRRLPDSEVLGGSLTWFAVDGLVINPATGGSNGGMTNRWGRWYPRGGILDTNTATWSALAQPPEKASGYPNGAVWGYPNAVAADDRLIFTAQGWLFDVSTSTWIKVPRPPGGTDAAQAVAIGDGDLYVWGGVTWDDDRNPLSSAGWTANQCQGGEDRRVTS